MDLPLPPICAILAFILYPARVGDGRLSLPSMPSLLSSCTLLEQEMDFSLPPVCAILAFVLYPARAGDGCLSLPSVPSLLSSCTLREQKMCLSLFLSHHSFIIIANMDGSLVHPYSSVAELVSCRVSWIECSCHECADYSTISLFAFL